MSETVTQSSLKMKKRHIAWWYAAVTVFILLAVYSFVEFVYAIRTDDSYLYVYNLIRCAGSVAVAVRLLSKQQDFYVPILIGVTFIPTKFMNLMYGYKYGDIHIDDYQAELVEVLYVCLLVAVYLLFFVRSPRIKCFMQKTKNHWYNGMVILTAGRFVLNKYFDSFRVYQEYDISFTFNYIKENVIDSYYFISVFFVLFEYFVWVLPLYCIVHLNGRTPKQKKFFAKHKDLTQSDYSRQNSLDPIESQPSEIVQTSLQPEQPYVPQSELQPTSSAVEELIKCKEMLDSGLITSEEFEKLKTDLLSK